MVTQTFHIPASHTLSQSAKLSTAAAIASDINSERRNTPDCSLAGEYPQTKRRVAAPKDGVLKAIGSTPLIRLRRFLESSDIALYAKIEASNPGGSAKDRPANAMIAAGIENGEIHAETTIVESSSGNMGIGLAQACRYHGLRFICVVDPRAQSQNVAIMRALGAEIELVKEPIEGDFLLARLSRVRALVRDLPDVFWPNQYANRANPRSHEEGTAAEIIASIRRPVDRVFVATSSTGTLTGCVRAFARVSPATKVVGIDAVGSVLFGGERGDRHISGFGAGCVPALASECHPAETHQVSDLDCVVGCRRMARKEAFLAGGSGGGVLQAVRRRQSELSGLTCVAILHDSGSRYLETVYDDAWVERVLKTDRSTVDALANDRIEVGFSS